jgi:thiosulfate reductase cytochrome b subunit
VGSNLASALATPTARPRYPAVVRITHWITALCFLALLLSGVEILISHPRLYWGETGNVLTPPLFQLPIPASRKSVPTGYSYRLPDQNGWSRSLHFQAGWGVVLAGFLYITYGLLKGHFRQNLLPGRAGLSWQALSQSLADHLRFSKLSKLEPGSYNLLQRLTYLLVIFFLFPLVIWTGLAMSPAIASVVPQAVSVLGGQQSARTIHFFVSVLLVFFLLVHVLMICATGFRSRMRAMMAGGAATQDQES